METSKEEQGLLGIVMNLISFLRKYFIVLLAFLAIGSFYGIRSHYNQQSSHKVKLVMCTSYIDNDIVAKLVNALQLYVENGDSKGLAIKMQTSPENVSGIGQIFADTTKAKLNAIRIDYSIGDATKIDSVNKGLTTYLNQNEYIHQVIALKTDQRNEIIARNKQRLQLLDSLNKLQNVSVASMQQFTGVTEETRILLAELQKAEYENLAYRNIYIIEENASSIPVRALSSSLLINIIAYLFIGLAISAVFEVMFLYVKREKQKKSSAKA